MLLVCTHLSYLLEPVGGLNDRELQAHFANCKARVEMSDGIMVMPNPSKIPGVSGSYSWTQWLKPQKKVLIGLDS